MSQGNVVTFSTRSFLWYRTKLVVLTVVIAVTLGALLGGYGYIQWLKSDIKTLQKTATECNSTISTVEDEAAKKVLEASKL